MNDPTHRARRKGSTIHLPVVLAALACLLSSPCLAQNVEFTQTSSPAGIVNQTTFPLNGAAVATISAPLTNGSYRFTHWTLNGVRRNNGSGSGANPASFTITVPTAAIANYMLVSQDTDGDTLPDWYEIHHFGNLVQLPGDDFDGDGFSNALELSLGQHPGIFDEREQGGTSRRRDPALLNVAPGVGDPAFVYGGTSRRRSAALTVILNGTLARLDETSDPVGILAQTRVLAIGTIVNLFTAPATSSGYRFTGWLVDGVRHDTPPQNQPIPITVNGNTLAVARYISETADIDGDGIADWIEWYHFNSLDNNLNSDPDGDGISLAVELFRNYSPLARDLPEPGGTSRRRGVMLDVSPTNSRVPFRLTSDPATIQEQTSLEVIGSLQTVPNLTNHNASGYKFAGWELNGARQADASGASLNQFSFVITAPATALARYVIPTVDNDEDGILDWHETYYYGSLAQVAAGDTDGDGFNYAAEVFRGQSPRVADLPEAGGVSRRRAPQLPVNAVLLNLPPAIGAMTATSITPNSGRVSTTVNPFGSATTAYFQYGTTIAYTQQTLAQNLGNGLSAQAISADLIGLQPGTTYHFRLVATNGNGTTLGDDATFTTGSTSGYQAWADFHEVGGPGDDDDNDRLLNLLEFATNSDPNISSQSPTTLVMAEAEMEFYYTRARAALDDGCVFTVEWSDNLAAPWFVADVVEEILTDNGTLQNIKVTIPLSPSGERYARLRVER